MKIKLKDFNMEKLAGLSPRSRKHSLCIAFFRCISTLIFFLSVLFIPSVVHAVTLYQKCVNATVCTGPYPSDCSIKTYCEWVLGDPPTYSPPPPFSAPTPTPQYGGPSSTPSAEEIEKEAHRRFCKTFPAKIAAAISDCTSSAKGYRSYVVSSKCPGSGTVTWSLKFSKDGLESGFSTSFSPGADCRENAQFAMEASIAGCEASGAIVLAAHNAQCADVN